MFPLSYPMALALVISPVWDGVYVGRPGIKELEYLHPCLISIGKTFDLLEGEGYYESCMGVARLAEHMRYKLTYYGDFPNSWEWVRFPSEETANHQLQVVEEYFNELERWHRSGPPGDDAGQVNVDIKVELIGIRYIWQLVKKVAQAEGNLEKRYALEVLRERLGKPCFYAGALPGPVPPSWHKMRER